VNVHGNLFLYGQQYFALTSVGTVPVVLGVAGVSSSLSLHASV
jgi:hypothetical protein